MRRFELALLLISASVLPGQAAQGEFRRDLLAGLWKANWAKSTIPDARAGSQRPALYRQYVDHGDGFMLHTVMVVAPGQQAPQLQLLGAVKYDNKAYPTYTPGRLTDLLAADKQAAQTVTFKVIDEWNMEWTDKTNGKVTAAGTMMLSQDGKTMTFTSHAFNPEGKQVSQETLIFEKE